MICKKCGRCCSSSTEFGVIITPEDMKSISKYLGMRMSEFVNIYCFNICIEDILIYFLKSNGEQCVFLDKNLCSIYDVRPTQCVLAPYAFFSSYELWKHLSCVPDENTFNKLKLDSSDLDRKIIASIMDGYYINE